MMNIILTAILSGVITVGILATILYILYKKGYVDKIVRYIVRRVIKSIGSLKLD